MDRKPLEDFLGQQVTLVTEDAMGCFAKHGEIKELFDTCLSFLTDNKLLLIDYSRIKEVRMGYK